jgi:PAS domain S-box-containing protein
MRQARSSAFWDVPIGVYRMTGDEVVLSRASYTSLVPGIDFKGQEFMDNHESHDTQKTLRQRAEDLVKQGGNYDDLAPADIHKLAHELQVYRAEVDIQLEELQQSREELERARNAYVDLYDFAPVGYLTIDQQTHIVAANLTAATLLGLEREQLIDRHFSNFILPPDQDTYYFHQKHLDERRTPHTCELRLKCSDGSFFHARLNSTVVKLSRDQWQYRTTISDISERVEAQEKLHQSYEQLEQRVEERTAELREANRALRASEERFRVVLKDSPTVVFTHDANLRYTWLYPIRATEEKILGKTDKELLGLDGLDHLTEEEAERLTEIKQQVFDTGQGVRTEVQLTTGGVQRWYDIKLEPMYTGDNQIDGLTGAATDISSYRQEREQQRMLAEANARLYKAEQYERARAEATADRIARLQQVTALLSEARTPDEVFNVIVEKGFTAIGAYAGGVALLRDDDTTVELVHQQGYLSHLIEQWRQYPMTASSPVAACIRTGELLCIENPDALAAQYPEVEVSDQSHAWANIPLTMNAQVRGCLLMSFPEVREFSDDDRAFLRNLGQQCAQALERAQLYEAEQQARAVAEDAIKMRDQVFRLVSHDLRSPLTTIQGYTYLVRQRLQNAQTPHHEKIVSGLSKIEQATMRMNGQIQELLDAALAQAGQELSLSYRSLDLIALLHNTIEIHRSTTDNHTLHLSTDVQSLTMMGDEIRLERVFHNLLNNAIKYSPGGGEIVVTVQQHKREAQDWVSIAVQDQGVGIPDDALPTIFEAFRRASTTAEQIAGIGLGLVSVRQIIEQQGGTIEVKSKEGTGSTFTVWLPIQQDPVDID